MRKVFKKIMASAMTVAMAATLLIGVDFTPATLKACSTDVTSDVITPWLVYSAGQITRSNDPDGWPERYYSSFTTSEGEKKTDWNANFPNKQYVDGGEETWQTTKKATGFTADIANTGWDGEYEDGKKDAVGDNPYMLNAKMQQVKLKEGHYYTISMDLAWTNGEKAPEKNVQINIVDANTNTLDAQKVTIPSGQTKHYESTNNNDGTFTVATQGTDTINITVAMGAFLYSHDHGKTTEDVAAKGKLVMSNLKIVDEGAIPGYVPAPSKPEVTTPAGGNNNSGNNNSGNNNSGNNNGGSNVVSGGNNGGNAGVAAKKLSKVKGLKVKNKKKGTIAISWKKVASAKKYQVKVGKKTYNTSKAKLTVKKLKKGKKYTIKVRATASGYTSSAWASKKVKIKK